MTLKKSYILLQNLVREESFGDEDITVATT